MKVFVTGASGWIGSSVVPELVAAGHEVTGLARSDESAAVIEELGGKVVLGTTSDLQLLAEQATAADGTINLAFGDFTDFVASAMAETAAIQAIGAALEGTNKPFVITSGTPMVFGQFATETDNPPPAGPTAVRAAGASAALDFATRGVRSSVVRLPRSVHRQGDSHGFIAQLSERARAEKVSGYVGDGSQRWPAVHVMDAAVVYRLSLENAPAGSVLHAVGDEGIPILDIATAIGEQAGVPTASLERDDFGFLGLILAYDQPASAAATRALLNWAPTHPTLLEDIAAGFYAG